jgi:GT2 family glycosyltransferase
MKLSVVIICWNDLKYIADCLRSIYAEAIPMEFEVIVTDNGSTDGSLDFIRQHFPQVRIVANGANIGYGPGNNAGFNVAIGEYVLILNPDTLICPGALNKLVEYADRHPEAAGFGCRAKYPNGVLQDPAQPTPTVRGQLLAALYLRWLGRFSSHLIADTYAGWDRRSEREIGYQAGMIMLVRRSVLKSVGGFDERFFHQFEDADLGYRIWQTGSSILYCPDAEIIHIGGANRGTYPIKVILETQRSRYKFFHKHYGLKSAKRIRRVSLIEYGLRYVLYNVSRLLKRKGASEERVKACGIILKWHWKLDPARFLENGEEPDLGYKPLAPARKLAEKNATAESAVHTA